MKTANWYFEVGLPKADKVEGRCPMTNLPTICCAHCNTARLRPQVEKFIPLKRGEVEAPFYGASSGHGQLSKAIRFGESTGKTFKPEFGGK